jgi:hypothetical protein
MRKVSIIKKARAEVEVTLQPQKELSLHPFFSLGYLYFSRATKSGLSLDRSLATCETQRRFFSKASRAKG